MLRSLHLSVALILLSGLTTSVTAQEFAVTETGDTIVIYMDGSWTYADGSVANFFDIEISLDTSDQQFSVPEGSGKMAKSDLEFFSIMYKPEMWKRIPPGELNDEAEMAFEGNGFDAYAVIISEEVEIGTYNIFKIAIDNMAEFLGTQPKILAAEVRNVNGHDLVMGIFDLEFNGMKITYQAYYHSSEKGTIQFTSWTGTNVYEKYGDRMEDLLNGLIID